jgi:abortive infection bacteriophage resistance protein
MKRGAKEQILKLKFTFDVVFELLREEDEKKKLGKPYGIKIEKFEKWITLKDNKD